MLARGSLLCPLGALVGASSAFLSAPRVAPRVSSAAAAVLYAPLAPSWVASSSRAPPVRHATSKAGGSTKNGRDSKPKYLGIKLYGGEAVAPGNIILRQRGARYGIVESTATVAFGKDWTIYALQPGHVHFWYHAMKRKHYVEVLRSAPGAPLEKYPIVRLDDWEVPELLRLPADTPVSDAVRARLLAYLRAVPPGQLHTLLPRGRAAVGGVETELWPAPARRAGEGEGEAAAGEAGDAGEATRAAAGAQAAAALA